MQAAQQARSRSHADAGGTSAAAERVAAPGARAASALAAAVTQSPRMIAQRQQIARMQAAAARQPAAVLQRAIDAGKLNLVAEDHSEYQGEPRRRQKVRVEGILGDGTYHTEDVFSAMPDIREDGDSDNEKDLLHNFASKADPPYYAILQGLEFIELWCSQFRSYRTDADKLPLINGAHKRIETSIDAGSLARMTDSDEEAMFVHRHDLMREALDRREDPAYPRENLLEREAPYELYYQTEEEMRHVPRRDLEAELRRSIEQLRLASAAYRLAIERTYADARQEFEAFIDIDPMATTVQKRSVTMGFHAMVYALHGHTGVVKMGELHIEDLADKDLGDVTLSSDQELENFLTREELRRNGNGDGNGNGGL